MEKLLFTLGLITTGLALGYSVQKMAAGGSLSLPVPVSDLRKFLQKISLLFFMPVSFLSAVWSVSFHDIRVILLPVVGFCTLIAGGLLGLGLARLLKIPVRQYGVLFCCGSFTNIGAIGGLVCYLFLGEVGFALVTIYKMSEEISYYTIGFPIARFYSGLADDNLSPGHRIVQVLTDPYVAAALLSLAIGLLLNLLHVPRPHFFETVTAVSVPLGTFILIVSIGLGMRMSSVASYLRESVGISIIKFTMLPAIACTLAYLFGLHQINNGLPFKVVMILSSMPVAFNALLAASIYDLDLDLANSCWLVSTSCLIFILPGLYFLVHFF